VRSFWHVVILIFMIWVLGSVWLSLIIGHRIKLQEMEIQRDELEYKIAKVKAKWPPNLVEES
jgi:hypothetical protein